MADFIIQIIEFDISTDIIMQNKLSSLILDSSSANKWLEATNQLIRIFNTPKALHVRLDVLERIQLKLKSLDSNLQFLTLTLGLLEKTDTNE